MTTDEQLFNGALIYGFFAATCLAFIYHTDPAQALWVQKMTALAAVASLSFGVRFDVTSPSASAAAS
ncbi:hypothetical protein ACFHWW_26575 [Ensifer sp. P24N7]|uniref:hypothetical protein n=1 Tax=Sinorhizobium sp. P24N7 TaxID=3348358 RepID=UPI0035F3955C